MYKKKQWRKLTGLLGGWWQHQSRMQMSCHTYWLTMKVSSPQKVDPNQPLPDDWCCLISQNHIVPALFDHDFGGNREKGRTWCLSIWSPSYHQSKLGLLKHILTSLFHYCSVPSHFWSGWTSGAHLMYPVLSYWVSPDQVHLLSMNMTALMVGILRVEERWNEHAFQAIDIDSRSKLKMFLDWLKTCPSARDNKIASWDVCFQSEFWKGGLHC